MTDTEARKLLRHAGLIHKIKTSKRVYITEKRYGGEIERYRSSKSNAIFEIVCSKVTGYTYSKGRLDMFIEMG